MKFKLKILIWISFLFTQLILGQSFPNPASLSTGQGPIGSLDPNWEVSPWYTTNPPNPIGLTYSPALINNNCAPGAWVTPSRLPAPINNGNWITGSDANCGTNLRDGYRYFRIKLNLPALCNGKSIANSGNYILKLSGYVDNIISDVFVNGTSKGIRGGDYVLGGQLNMSLSGPWIAGINYIDVLVNNEPNNDLNPYGLLLVADYSASLNTDTDGDGISDLLDACPCEPGSSSNGCCTAPQVPTGATNQYFCSTATVTDLVAVGGTIKWYDSATGGTVLASTTTLVNGAIYYAASSNGSCESTTRLAVTANSTNVPEITSSNTSICIGENVQLSINTTTPASAIFTSSQTFRAPWNINWAVEAGKNYILKVSGTYGITSTSGIDVDAAYYLNSQLPYNQPCSGYQDRWKLIDNCPARPNPDTFNSQHVYYYSILNSDGNVNISYSDSLYGDNSGSLNFELYNSVSYLWSTGETTASINPKPLVTTTYWVDVTTNGITCRKSIIITVKNTPAPTGTGSQLFCEDTTIKDLVVNGTAIVWYPTATSTSAISSTTNLVNGTTYFATQTVDGCESTNRFQTTVSIVKIPSPTGDSIQKFCFEENPTITNLKASGTNINWLDAATNGMVVNNTSLLQDNTTYFATSIDTTTGCESVQRLAVTIDLFKCNITAYNLITINGNSLNDQLTFDDISYFPDNSVKIYNRYGKLVWETTGYDNTINAFKGKANVSGVYMKDSFLPAGTYFFILVYNNTFLGKQTELTGYLQIDNAN